MKINEAKDQLQQDALASLEASGYNGMIIIPTGSGKGRVLVQTLLALQPSGKVWYLCDSEDNRDKTFKKELIKWGAAEWVDRLEYMCYQTAYKREGEHIDLCLADESDFALTPEYSKVFFNNRFKNLVLCSATLAGEKRELAEKIRPVVFERLLKDVEDEGIVNGARHHLVNFMLLADENEQYLTFNRNFVDLLNAPKVNNQRVEMLQIQRKHFLSSLQSAKRICRKLLGELYQEHEENKVLVFCGLSDQADAICKYSYHSKSEYDYLTPFDKGELRTLSVVGKIDRGVNLNGVNKIIFESPTKSSTKFTQRSGRGRRLEAGEILDIYYLIPYYKTRKGTIEPTIVKKWVFQATSNVNFNPLVYKID